MRSEFIMTTDCRPATVSLQGAEGASGESLASFARSQEGDFSVALLGRLLYRAELKGGEGVGASRSDAELVLQLYRKEGPKALERLEGEFSLALWDGRRNCLVGMRDPFGTWPLFWRQWGSTLAMGTRLQALAGLQPGAGTNLDFIAEFLMWPNPHDELPIEETARSGIFRVLPGSLVTLFADGRVHRQKYWSWEKEIAAAQSDPSTAGEKLASLLAQAVRERCRFGPVAAHFSGGMDSTAIACLAERELRGEQPLHALALTYERPSLAGERKYIDLALRHAPRVVPHFLRGESVAPFDWFSQPLPAHDEPYAGLPGMVAERLLTEAGQHAGAKTILTGLGSDEILASNPLEIADSVQAGRWWEAVQRSRAWGQAVGKGAWSIFRHYGLEPLWPILFREGIVLPWQDGFGDWPRLGWHAVPRWISRDFARKHHLWQRGKEHARRLAGRPLSSATQIAALRTTIGDWVRWNIAAPAGMNISHPFRDPRVVCHALSVPLANRSCPSERKPLLQHAMRGVLPEEIRVRRTKRGFDDIYGLGLARNLSSLEELVRESSLIRSGLLEPEPLLAAMRQAALGIGDVRACERIDKTLALIAWAERLPDGEQSEAGQAAKLTHVHASGRVA